MPVTVRTDGRCNLLRSAILRARAKWAADNSCPVSLLDSGILQRISTDCSGLDTPILAAQLCDIPFEQPPHVCTECAWNS